MPPFFFPIESLRPKQEGEKADLVHASEPKMGLLKSPELIFIGSENKGNKDKLYWAKSGVFTLGIG